MFLILPTISNEIGQLYLQWKFILSNSTAIQWPTMMKIPCFKFHVTMSMYVLLKMTKIKSTKYHNLIMIKHELRQQI